MALVILMRHGEAENNVLHTLAGRTLEFHLTERGRTQVADSAEKLKSMHIRAIYTSPIARAVETAQIVSEKIGVECKIDERLIETDMGSVTGMGYSDVLNKYGDLFSKFYENADVVSGFGVEKFSAITERMGEMLDYVAEKHHNTNVLLVTHLDPIKAAITRIMDLKPEALFKMAIRNASLTVLKHSSRDYTLSAFNIMDMSRYNLE
jgi:probable phosphoglycerate mutase